MKPVNKSVRAHCLRHGHFYDNYMSCDGIVDIPHVVHVSVISGPSGRRPINLVIFDCFLIFDLGLDNLVSDHLLQIYR